MDNIRRQLFESLCVNGHLNMTKLVSKLFSVDLIKTILMRHNNQIICETCEEGHFEIVKWLYDLCYEYEVIIGYNNVFLSACKNGNLKMMRWIYEQSLQDAKLINIHYQYDQCFYYCCQKSLDAVKWLIQLSVEINDPFDFKFIKHEGFQYACIYNQLDIAKWLLTFFDNNATPLELVDVKESLFQRCCSCSRDTTVVQWLVDVCSDKGCPIDIHANNDHVFRLACHRGNIIFAKWLYDYALRINSKIDIQLFKKDLLMDCWDNHFYMYNWLNTLN